MGSEDRLFFAFVVGLMGASLFMSASLVFFISSVSLAIVILNFFFAFLIVFFGAGLFITGRSYWWYLLLITSAIFFLEYVLTGIVKTLSAQNVRYYLIPTIFASLPITGFFVWRWTRKIYDGEWVSEVLSSKRIDFEKGIVSPFTAPAFPRARQIAQFLFFLMIIGSIVILFPALVLGGHWTGRYFSEIQFLGPAVIAYAWILITVGIVGLLINEHSWIRTWEHKTGRNMFLSYIVELKYRKKPPG